VIEEERKMEEEKCAQQKGLKQPNDSASILGVGRLVLYILIVKEKES